MVLQGGWPGKDSFADEGDRHSVVEGRDCRPLSGALLSGRIPDFLDEGVSGGVSVLEDVGRDLDEERIELALVPLVEGFGHLVVAHAQQVLHDVIGLADQLQAGMGE